MVGTVDKTAFIDTIGVKRLSDGQVRFSTMAFVDGAAIDLAIQKFPDEFGDAHILDSMAAELERLTGEHYRVELNW